MSPKASQWRMRFLVLAVIALCAWGGLFLVSRNLHSSPQVNAAFTAKLSTPPGKENFVRIPAGEFTMGSDEDVDEQPIHVVKLAAFWIAKTETTNEQFSAFIAETGYKTDAERTGWAYTWDGFNWIQTTGADWQHPNGVNSDILGRERHPVTQVSWNDASAYCAWLGGRLPTEAEWEKAARGTDQRAYPWGNEEPDKTRLNFLNNMGGTTEVGSYPNGVSPYGAYDMAGNVWEWTGDWYQDNYYATLEDGVFNPQGPESGDGKILRGGSWINFYYFIRTSERRWSNPQFAFGNYGIRCVRSSE